MKGNNDLPEKILQPEELIKLLLAQQAAESYLAVRGADDKVSYVGSPMDPDDKRRIEEEYFDHTTQAGRYALGANNADAGHELKRGGDGRIQMIGGEHWSSTLATPQMTQRFAKHWEVIDQLPNTDSGLSATLLRDRDTGQYTLSIRSTESKSELEGGDVSNDSERGANGQIGWEGFAWYQLADLESYYQDLRQGKLATGNGESDSDIRGDFSDPEMKINITGYSLGSHNGQVFTLMHPEVVEGTTIVNGAGMGIFKDLENSGLSPAELAAEYGRRVKEVVDLINEFREDPEKMLEGCSREELLRVYEVDLDQVFSEEEKDWSWPEDDITTTQMIDQILHRHENAPRMYEDPLVEIARERGSSWYDIKPAAWVSSEEFFPFGEDAVNPSTKITRFFGEADDNDMNLVANSALNWGEQSRVFIEDQIDFTGLDDSEGLTLFQLLFRSFGPTHSKQLVIDSLWLSADIQTVSPSLENLNEVQLLYSLANNDRAYFMSGVEDDSLEATLDGIGNILYGESWEATPYDSGMHGFANLGTREGFHIQSDNLSTWQEKFGHVSITPLYRFGLQDDIDIAYPGKIPPNAIQDGLAQSIADEALSGPDQLAHRYALMTLNPFIATSENSDLYTKFDENGMLSSMSWGNGGQFLQDRADMLVLDMSYNLYNTDYTSSPGKDEVGSPLFPSLPQYYYLDIDSGKELLNAVSDNVDFSKNHYPQRVFGSADPEHFGVFSGGAFSDHFWGGAGGSIQYGFGGDDLHSGLNHNMSDDNATDILHGGIGYDTYWVGNKDHIEDSDSAGVVYFQGKDVPIFFFEKGEGYHCYYVNNSEEYGAVLDLFSGNLIIDNAGASFTIDKFSNQNSDFSPTECPVNINSGLLSPPEQSNENTELGEEEIGPLTSVVTGSFSIEDDGSIYLIYSDGQIVRSPTVAGFDAGQSGESINSSNLPGSEEELIEQLEENGLTSGEATDLVNSMTGLEFFAAEVSDLENEDDPGKSDVVAPENFDNWLADDVEDIDIESNGYWTDLSEITLVDQEEFPQEAEETEEPETSTTPTEDTLLGFTPQEWQEINGRWSDVETVEDAGDELSSVIAASEEGDDWEVFESSVDLLSSVESLLADKLEQYPDLLKSQSANVQGGAHLVNAVGSFQDLQDAIETGDDWKATESATMLAESGFDGYNSFNDVDTDVYDQDLDNIGFSVQGGKVAGAASAVVSLAINMKDLVDALDSGDTVETIDAALQMIDNGTTAYVAAVEAYAALTGVAASSALQLASTSLPAIGAAVGIAQGVLSMFDGDVEGGVEQIALTTATYCLLACGPYGWIGALALQLGSATRNCDGRLIDKENIEDFAEDVSPGGAAAAKVAIASVELPSELAAEVYEGSSYLSGFNFDFYEDIDVEIPEDMEAEFTFNQTVLDANNPLRYAEYFTDLEDLSLSDIWDSTYITQTIVAGVDQVKNCPKFIVSTITDSPELIVDLVGAALKPENITNIFGGIFGDDDPPSATASFSLDQNDQLVMDVSGDSEMQETAAIQGSQLLQVMENYEAGGGRLLIDGSLPSFTAVSGEDSRLDYAGDGGRVTVLIDDPSSVPLQLQTVLYGRDRGERVENAVALGTNSSGEIDLARVDSILAGYGFHKVGMTYTYGEVTQRECSSSGTGVFAGGGNMGPGGEHFTAGPDDIHSLPLRPDQLPSQKVGRISRIIGLSPLFGGTGSELMAMALAHPGDTPDQTWSGAPVKPEVEQLSSLEYTSPLSPFDYLDLDEKPLGEATVEGNLSDPVVSSSLSAEIVSTPDHQTASVGEDASQKATELLDRIPENFGGVPVSFFPVATTQQHSVAEPVVVTTPSGRKDDSPGDYHLSHGLLKNGEPPAVLTGSFVTSVNMAGPDDARIPDIEPEINYGSRFVMPEGAILRILPFQLAETSNQTSDHADHGQYTLASENDIFHELGSATGGRVWQQENGELCFEAAKGFVGTATFSYKVQTSTGEILEKTSAITVENVNSDPLLHADSFQLQEGDLLFLDRLLANDYDPDGDPLVLDHISGFDHGTVSLVDGNLAFIPTTGFHGDIELTYWVQGGGYPVPSTALLHYSDVNNGVEAGIDRYLTLQGEGVSTSVSELLANDQEYDGETFQFTGLGDSRYGTVTIDEDGRITFIPDSGYSGTEAGFSYNVEDASGNITSSWAGIEVLPVQSGPEVISWQGQPISSDDILSFTPDEIASFVHDPDGDLLRLDMITNVTGGKIVIENGTYAFIPDGDFVGTASFDYRVNDGHQGVANGHLAFEVLDQDGQPDNTVISKPTTDVQPDQVASPLSPSVAPSVAVANTVPDTTDQIEPVSPDSLTQTLLPDQVYYYQTLVMETTEEQMLTMDVATLQPQASQDSQGDGAALSFMGIGEVFHGEVHRGENGTLEFLPRDDYFGDEAGFTYTLSDGQGRVESCLARVRVANVNDAPVVTGDRLLLGEDQSLTFTAGELSKFLYDADREPLFLESMTALSGGLISQSGNIFCFTPDPDFYGEVVLSYSASDGAGEKVSGQLSLGITPVNDTPYGGHSSGFTFEEQELLFSIDELMVDSGDLEDGKEVRFGGVESSVGGDVYTDEEGVHFMPHKDFFGNGSFRYRVLDKEGGIGFGTVSVSVEGTQDAPVAGDDSGILAWSNNGFENIYMVSALLANDVDADLDSLGLVDVGEASYGTVNLDPNGFIRYCAVEDNAVGIDQFTYTIADSAGNLAEATAEIEVRRNNSPDVLSELLVSTEDTVSFLTQQQLLQNDCDVNNDSLRIIGVNGAVHCTVELLDDGSIRFAPDQNFNNLYPGQASFEYSVSDGISDPVTGVAHMVLAPENDSPIPVGDLITGAIEDNSFSFHGNDLLANDIDVEMESSFEQDALFFGGVWGADHGTMSYDPGTDTVIYIPAYNFNGVDSFQYLLVDSHGAQSVGTGEIHVQPVNDRPVVQEDVGSPAEETIWNYYSIAALIGNDYDVDGDSLSITNPFLLEGRGSVRISGDKLAVQPVAGEDKMVVGYSVSDGHGGEVASKLTIPDILEHNYAPTFSGLYSVGWKNGYTVWFNFHAEDRNGGNSWGNPGDIVGVSASAPSTGKVTQQSDNPYTFKFKGDVDKASVVLTVVDQAGATGSIFVEMSHLAMATGTFHYSPVVLDLDGDGIELVDLSHNVAFDWNLDGEAENSGWVGPDDGLLVYDYDGDQLVSFGDEVSLTGYHHGAMTDLEGLKGFDTDGDNIFSGTDLEYSSFGVWQDGNSNGVTDIGEFESLVDAGICSIELQSDGKYHQQNSNIIYGETVYHLDDGTIGIAGDVGLNGEEIVFTEVEQTPEQLVDSLEVAFSDDATGEAEVLNMVLNIEEQATMDALIPADTEQSIDSVSMGCEEESNIGGVYPDSELVTLLPGSTEAAPIETDLISAITLPDEAELNRQYLQLTSDMAAFGDSKPLTSVAEPQELAGGAIEEFENPSEVETEMFAMM